MELQTITLDMIQNAPPRVKAARGRQKGSSDVEKAWRAGFALLSDENPIAFSAKLTKASEYPMLRTSVNRSNGEDTGKVGPYRAALEHFGLCETILAEDEKTIVVAIARPLENDWNEIVNEIVNEIDENDDENV